MRILFDHQVFSWQTYGGISRYFAEQLRELKSLGQSVYLPEHFYSENVYLRNFPAFQRQSLTSFSFKGKKLLQNVLGRKSSLKALKQIRPEVFHPTYFDPYFLKNLKKQGVPLVVTVHDMIHEIYGHGSSSFFSLDARVIQNKRLLVQKADAVISVSNHTRQDLLRFCPEIDPAKIHVIPHGNAMQRLENSVPSVSKPYLLFVGQRKAYKNFAWMLNELSQLLLSKSDLQLICVGGGNFDAQELAQIKDLGLAQKVQYQRVTTDVSLAELYSHAACFIFPSQYEGFGIPVLEAFACGCPAVLNRASSLPEVGGDAAAYFEESKPGDLSAVVEQVITDVTFRNAYVEAGLKRAQQFTWAKSAAQHLAVYQSIVK